MITNVCYSNLKSGWKYVFVGQSYILFRIIMNIVNAALQED